MELFSEKISKDNYPLLLAGADEVGRGPLAGPVVACSVKLEIRDSHSFQEFKKVQKEIEKIGVTDSKTVTAKKRKRILAELGIKNCLPGRFKTFLSGEGFSLGYALYSLPPAEIDKLNIFRASLEAMERALKLGHRGKTRSHFFKITVDGKFNLLGPLRKYSSPLIKGDKKNFLIALASLIAKEYRDGFMELMAKKYPHYGFEKHAGYPTKWHKQQLRLHGPSPIHRKTFRGVLTDER